MSNQRIRHPDYWVWKAMRHRCSKKYSPDYQNYGAKGITYDKSWDSFEKFLQDMGPRANRLLTLDRIDNSKGYFKENCRWATRTEQTENRNTRTKCRKGHIWTEESTGYTWVAGKNGKKYTTRTCLTCKELRNRYDHHN